MAEETVNIKVLIEASKSAKTIDDLERSVEDLNKELDKVSEGSKEFKELEKAITKAEKSMVDIALATDQTNATIGDLEKNVEVLSEALKGVDRGSAEFETLRQKLVDTNRELKNVELSLEALDTDQVAGELGGVAGAVGDVTSAFILMGGEGNETIEQIGQRIETAMAVAIGFKGAIEGIQSGLKLYRNFGTIVKNNTALLRVQAVATKILDVAQNGLAKATGISSTALKAFRTALITTGIGAIVVAIGALIANWDKLTSAISTGTRAQELSNEASEKAIESAGEELSALDKLQKTLQDETLTREEKNRAVRNLQEQYPDLLANVDAEKLSLRELNDALLLNTQLVTLQAETNALAELRTEAFKQKLQEQTDQQTGANVGLWDYISSIEQYTTLTGIATASTNGYKTAQDFANESTAEAVAEIDKEIEAIDGLTKTREADIQKLKEQLGIDDESLKAKKEAEEAQKKADEAQKKRDERAKQRREQRKRNVEQLTELEKTLAEEILQQNIEAQGLEEQLEKRRLKVAFEASNEKIKKLIGDDAKLKTVLALNEKKFKNDLQKIEDKFEDLADEKRKALITKEKETALEIELIDEQLQLAKLDNTKENEKKRLEIEQRIQDVRIKQIENARDEELKNTELTAQERIAIEKRAEKEILDIRNEARAEDLQNQKEANEKRAEEQEALKGQLFTLAMDTAQLVADTSFEIAQANADREAEAQVNALENAFNQENELLNAQVEQGLITQREADRKAKELERKKNKELEELARQKFNEDKKRQTAQAIINGALAFTNALATTQPLVPAGLIAGAGVLISTGAQVATIQSQQYARGGILNGPSHKQGGIKTQYGELEGGEAVINKRSTSMFKGTLSRINQAGGGVKFASGGILGTTGPGSNLGDSGDLANVLQRLNTNLEKPTRSYVVESDITDSQTRVENLENNADI